jgi:hypothetical protein
MEARLAKKTARKPEAWMLRVGGQTPSSTLKFMLDVAGFFSAIFIVSIKVAEVASVGRGFPMLHRRDSLRLFGHFLFNKHCLKIQIGYTVVYFCININQGLFSDSAYNRIKSNADIFAFVISVKTG